MGQMRMNALPPLTLTNSSMKNLSSIAWPLIGLAALILIPFATKPFTPEPVYNEANAAILSEILNRNDPNEQKGDILDAYLSRLAWTYECVGECAKAQRLHQPYKRIDSNNQYSYGCLQFQQATYLAVAKKYKIDPWKGDGIYDCNNQWELARAMFLEDKEAAAGHWHTSIFVRGLGLPKI